MNNLYSAVTFYLFSYINAGKVGQEIVIDSSASKIGKTLAFLTVDIKNKADGKIIAQGKHTKFVGSWNDAWIVVKHSNMLCSSITNPV